jgi:hypothetical protein
MLPASLAKNAPIDRVSNVLIYECDIDHRYIPQGQSALGQAWNSSSCCMQLLAPLSRYLGYKLAPCFQWVGQGYILGVSALVRKTVHFFFYQLVRTLETADALEVLRPDLGLDVLVPAAQADI